MRPIPPSSSCMVCGFVFESPSIYTTNYPSEPMTTNPLGLRHILSCPNCDFGTALPRPSQEALDTYYSSGQYWDEYTANAQLEAHQVVQAKVRLASVREQLSTECEVRVLDIGAGLCFMGDELSNWAKQVGNFAVSYTAVEPDQSTSKRAMSRLRTSVVSHRVLTSINEASGHFELIFLNHVLEHVQDPVAFLSKVGLLLSQSGVLYVEVPYRDDRFKTDVFPHVLFFSPTSLRIVSQRAGFSTNSVESFGVTESAGHSIFQRVYSRIERSILGRVFNLCARRGWVVGYEWADRRLYQYRTNATGIWLRAILSKQI